MVTSLIFGFEGVNAGSITSLSGLGLVRKRLPDQPFRHERDEIAVRQERAAPDLQRLCDFRRALLPAFKERQQLCRDRIAPAFQMNIPLLRLVNRCNAGGVSRLLVARELPLLPLSAPALCQL